MFVIGIVNCQNSFIGNYEGFFNGDNVSMVLESAGPNLLKGSMNDNHNHYIISATFSKNKLSGMANEATLGIELKMYSVLENNILSTEFVIDILGVQDKMQIEFVKTSLENKSFSNPIKAKNSSLRDSRVVGIWVKEQNYSSGYGSNGTYGSMSSRESMVFNQDGTMSEGENSTVIGGNNYSGTSSSNGGNVVAGLIWRTDNSKIFLMITQDGKTQEVELGKYYIENGRMLITGTNGEKLLLTKQ
jgi:hypothetical protein